MRKKLLSMVLALVMALGMAVCGGAEDAIATVRRDLDEMYTIWGLEWDMPLEEALQKIDENGGWDREYEQLYKNKLFRPWDCFYYNLNSEDKDKEIIVDVRWKDGDVPPDRWIRIAIQDKILEKDRNIQTFVEVINAMLKEGIMITAGGCGGYENGKWTIRPWIRENGKPDLSSMHDNLINGKFERYWITFGNLEVTANILRISCELDVVLRASGEGIIEYPEEFNWTKEDAQIFNKI